MYFAMERVVFDFIKALEERKSLKSSFVGRGWYRARVSPRFKLRKFNELGASSSF